MEVDNHGSEEDPQGRKGRIRRRWGLGAYTFSAWCMSSSALAILYIFSVLFPAKQKLVSPILWIRRLRLNKIKLFV